MCGCVVVVILAVLSAVVAGILRLMACRCQLVAMQYSVVVVLAADEEVVEQKIQGEYDLESELIRHNGTNQGSDITADPCQQEPRR